MRIISNNECYVQKSDLEYIVENEKNIPNEIYNDLSRFQNDKEYLKIDNQKSLECVLNTNIIDFSLISNYDVSKLEKEIIKLKLLILDEFDSDMSYEEEEDINKIIQERKNREYILKQLKEMIEYKSLQSKINYPNIPNPNYESITNDNMCASRSINPNEIVVYNLDGSRVVDEDNKEFIEISYKLLLHDELDSKKILELTTYNDGKYLVVKNNLEKVLKKVK